MAILEMAPKDSPVLRKKASEVKKITPEIKKLIEDMFDTMYATDGIGLAAPQVGVSKRIIVVDIEEHDQFYPPIALINPKIIEWSDEENIAEEGCLSVPGPTAPVRRAERVTVEAMTVDGKEITVEGVGLMARVLQHEIDHLKGKLFVDRVKEEDKKLLKKQRAKSIFSD